jgi:hypothetical protein
MVSTTDGVHDRMRSAVPPCLIMEICDKSIKDLMRERHYPHFLSKVGLHHRRLVCSSVLTGAMWVGLLAREVPSRERLGRSS